MTLVGAAFSVFKMRLWLLRSDATLRYRFGFRSLPSRFARTKHMH